MKKILSLFLAVLMAISSFSCLGIITFAEDGEPDSIEIIPVSEKIYEEYTNGDWFENENEEYFYYNACLAEGDILEVTTDGVSIEYVYHLDEDEGDYFISADDEYLYLYEDVYISNNQYNDHWTVGSDNYFTVYYGSCETDVYVTITENFVKSLEFIPANENIVIENYNGWWNTTTTYVDDEEIEEEYFYYHYGYDFGDILRVTNNEDEVTDYVYSDGEDYGYYGVFISAQNEIIEPDNDVRLYCHQDIKHWTLGSDNYYIIEYNGVRVNVPVTVVENPVKSIEVILKNPKTVIENESGNWETTWKQVGDEEIEEEYFNYNIPWFEDGDVIRVTSNKNVVTDYVFSDSEYDFVNESGESIRDSGEFSESDNQREKHWTLGSDNYYEIRYFGLTANVPVTVVENPVKSIQFIPKTEVKYIQNSDGCWNEDSDGEEYYYYYEPWWKDGDILKVTNKDNTVTEYIYSEDDDKFISKSGEEISVDDVSRDSNQYSEHWTLGSNNYYTVEYLGKTANVQVTIAENPVKAIEFVPKTQKTVIENYSGEWRTDYDSEDENTQFYYYYYDEFEQGDILKVTDKDNNITVYTYDEYEFRSQSGELLDVGYLSTYNEQYSKHWTLGSDNYYTISYYGKTVDVPVTVVENPVKAVEYIPKSIKTYTEYTHGYWCDEDGDDKYYFYNLPDERLGDTLKVTYKNKTVSYVYSYIESSNEYDFVSASGERLEFDIEYSNNQYSKHWSVGSDNYYTVSYYGRTCDVPVKITADTVASITYSLPTGTVFDTETEDYYYVDNEGKVKISDYISFYEICRTKGSVLTVKYKDNTTEKYISNGSYFICGKKVIDANCKNLDFNYEKTSDTNFKITVKYGEASATCNLPIKNSNVKSIVFNPVLSNVNITTEDVRTDAEGKYYYCYKSKNNGDTITVKYNDGTSSVLTYKNYAFYDEQGNRKNVRFSCEMYGDEFKIGSNICYVEFGGVSTSFNINLAKASIKSVKYIPAGNKEVLFNDLWEISSNSDYTRYYVPYENVGAKFIITYNDNTQKTYTYTEYGNMFSGDSFWVCDDGTSSYLNNLQCYIDVGTSETLVGQKNITFEYLGVKSTLSIKFVENNVKDIEFVPASNKVNLYKDAANAVTEFASDTLKPEYYARYNYFVKGDKLTVKYDNNTKTVFTYNGKYFADASGNKLPDEPSISKWYNNGLHCSVYYGDCICRVYYEAVDDVKIVEFVCEKPIKINDDDFSQGVYLRYDRNIGEYVYTVYNDYELPDIFDYGYIKVTYNDNSTEKITNDTGSSLDCGCTYSNLCYEKEWVKGSDNAITLYIMGRAIKIPVTLTDACDHKYVDTVVKPTCTEGGYTLHKCSLCGDSYKDTVVKATGHSYVNGICKNCKCWENKTVEVKLGKTTVQNGSINVTWNKLAGAESYIVYRKAGSEKTWSKIGTSTTTSYTDKSVKSGTTYKYTVCGVYNKQNSKYNSTGISALYLSAPATKIVNKNGYISVSWSKISGAKGYVIYKKTGSGSYKKLATIKSGSTVSYTDKSVKSGTKYTYYVKAYNGSTYSSYKASSTIMYLSAVKISSAVSGKTGITVKWGKISASKGYVIYRKTGSGKYTKLATVKGATKVSYLDKSAKKGKTYTYYVVAFNGSCYGSYANTKACKDKY